MSRFVQLATMKSAAEALSPEQKTINDMANILSNALGVTLDPGHLESIGGIVKMVKTHVGDTASAASAASRATTSRADVDDDVRVDDKATFFAEHTRKLKNDDSVHAEDIPIILNALWESSREDKKQKKRAFESDGETDPSNKKRRESDEDAVHSPKKKAAEKPDFTKAIPPEDWSMTLLRNIAEEASIKKTGTKKELAMRIRELMCEI